MKCIVLYLVLLAAEFSNVFSEKCALRDYGNNRRVCVCNSTYCDTLEPLTKVEPGTFLKFTSNQDGLRFEKEIGQFTNTSDSIKKITIKSDEVFQSIVGFGGAFTDSTCINIFSLEEKLQNDLMRSLFSEDGLEYNVGRIPMAASDFSTRPYTYHDEEDRLLRNFSLAPEDYELKFPIIHWANNLTNNNMHYIVSTWIAPKWMKTNGEYAGGFLKEDLYQVWANYFVKFLDAYKEEGVTFWGITTGNEPTTAILANVQIPGIGFTSNMQRIFIRENMGPSIRSSAHSDIKILMFDDMRMYMAGYMDTILIDDVANSYVDGVALHWYLDRLVPAYEISVMHKIYPNKFFINTEASQGAFTAQPVQIGLWDRAEEYAFSIIEDMNNWVLGWVDWNMALDLEGGPTYVSNFCDAPILVNATAQEFLKQPMYYGLGHFSKFVPRDSQKIFFKPSSRDIPPVTAFKRPDGGVVVVVLNADDTSYEVVLEDENRGSISLNLTANSITTVAYW